MISVYFLLDFFLLSTDSSEGYQPMLASKRVEYVGKAVKVQM
ncbi:hypothetical protein [Segatella copri]|nr:hypothetical protein [Segatella copri]